VVSTSWVVIAMFCEMGLPGFDVIFRAAASAINVLVERLRLAAREISDDEPPIGPFFARFDACNNTFDAAPTCGAVVKLLEPAHLGLLRPGLETAFGARLERFDMTAQGRGRRNAEDEVEAVRPAEVDDLGATIVAVGANEDVRGRSVGPNCPEQTPKELVYFHAVGRLAGRSIAVTNRPSPSNTTTGWKPYSS
jgi:hypothetical protein